MKLVNSAAPKKGDILFDILVIYPYFDMSEVEKQEGQKTVVAFIAGLLIGGLLVWVFSSSEPAVAPTTGDTAQEVGEVSNTNSNTNSNNTSTTNESETETTEPAVAELPVGEGAIMVADQSAGSVVTISSASFPVADGWVAIRDYNNGMVGGILGAARFSQSQGLVPTEVELVRPEGIEAGKTYAAVFFTEDGSVNGSGSLYFDPAGDQQIDGILTEFTAQ
jgi:hypothetical protein